MKSQKIDTKKLYNLDVLKKEFDDKKVSLDDFKKSLESRGYIVRIVSVNGKPMMCTMDHRKDRVNIHVSGATEIVKVQKLDEEMKEIYEKDTLEYVKYTYGPETVVEKIVSLG